MIIMKNEKEEKSTQLNEYIVTILPAVIGLIGIVIDKIGFGNSGEGGREEFPWLNPSLQVLFVLATLFILNNCWNRTKKEAGQGEQIKRYLRVNFNLKDEDESSLNVAHAVVSGTAKQFFCAWIVIWLLWLGYYSGVCFSSLVPQNDYFLKVLMPLYRNVFNFLSSAVLFTIYLILTEATVHTRARNKSKSFILNGFTLLMVLALLFALPSLYAVSLPYSSDVYPMCMIFISLFLSIFSAISFTLIIGKLNSAYLQIPVAYIVILYFYAISQAYEPLSTIYEMYFVGQKKSCYPELQSIIGLLYDVIPYITLLGKVFLMLTLMWITNNQRIIFYIIHRSIALEEAPSSLKKFKRYMQTNSNE